MSITMKELAALAGVSRATVDRVINGRGRVNEKTENRIRALASAMGYMPNLAAKTLAAYKKSIKIGCIVTNIYSNPYIQNVASGISAAVAELSPFGIEVITRSIELLNVQQQLQYIDEMVEQQVSAILLSPINDDRIVSRLTGLIQEGMTVIAFLADIARVPYFAYVGIDNEKAGRVIAQCLSLITEDAAHVALVVGSVRSNVHHQRMEGFRHFLEEKKSSMVLHAVLENNDDDIISYNLVNRHLEEHPDTNAFVFAAGGSNGGIRALIDRDLIGKVKILAFDLTPKNREYLANGTISMLVAQDPFNQGYLAVKMLGDYFMHGKKPTKRHNYIEMQILVSELLT